MTAVSPNVAAPRMRATTLSLIAHELRLMWRDGGGNGRIARALGLLFLLTVPVLGGIGLGFYLRKLAAVPTDLYGLVSAVWLGLVVLMLSGAALHVLRVFHERADFDLLLAAPVPPVRVLVAKSVSVLLTVMLPMLVLLTPFVVTMAVLGHPGWTGALAMVAVAAVIATGGAFLLAGLLLRVMSGSQARTVVQIFSGIIGLTVGMAGQFGNIAPRATADVVAWLSRAPVPPWDAPARAVFGEPAALLLFFCLAGIAAIVSAQLAAGQLQASRSEPQPQHVAARFRGSAARVLFVKEWRLLRRDPELLATILLQTAYLIPAFGLIFIGGVVSPARLASAAVLLVGMVAGSLGWIIICGEDAPDLVAAAPLPPAQIRRIKLAAACLPPLALALPLLLALAPFDLRACLIGLGMTPVAALAASLLQGWAAKPRPRHAFRFRQRGSILLGLSEYTLASCWAWAVSLLLAGSRWVPAPFILAAVVLGIAWVTRRR